MTSSLRWWLPPLVVAFGVPQVFAGCGSTVRSSNQAAGGEAGAAAGGEAGQSPSTGGAGNSAGSAGTGNQQQGGSAGTSNGEGGSGDVTGASGDGGSAGGDVVVPPLDCVEGRAVTEAQTAGSTVDSTDDFALTCGSGTAPDAAFDWVVPRTDYYRITTAGSSFDTVLGLLDADCETELFCSNNVGSSPQSEIVARFERGEQLAIVVDGNVGENGDYTLTVEAVTCPETDLTGQPLPVELTTVGGENQFTGACGGDGPPEKTLRWVPPETGLYQFSVDSDEIDPALYVEAGAQCGSPLLGCTAGNRDSYPTEVTRWLEAGEPVTVVVDSRSGEGSFTFDIVELEVACPSQTAEPDLAPVTLDPDVASHVLSGSCQPSGAVGLGGPAPLVEHSYPLQIDLCVTCACTYTVESDFPVAVYVLRGKQCGGEELTCVVSENVGPSMYEASVQFGNADNGDYVFVVEASSPEGFTVTYFVSVQCVA